MAFLPDVINDLADIPWGSVLGGGQNAAPGSLMRADISETASDYVLEMELPGFSKKEIRLQLKDGYLVVSAKKEGKGEKAADGKKYLRRERSVESCSRAFYVGKDLDSSDIKARLADGILTLVIPKEVETPKGEEFIEIAD